MKISQMMVDRNVKPMQIAKHPDLTRAAWSLRSIGFPTPLDAILRDMREPVAEKLSRLGM